MSSGMLLNSHNRLGTHRAFSAEILGSGRVTVGLYPNRSRSTWFIRTGRVGGAVRIETSRNPPAAREFGEPADDFTRTVISMLVAQKVATL
jgi:hypothetical protein